MIVPESNSDFSVRSMVVVLVSGMRASVYRLLPIWFAHGKRAAQFRIVPIRPLCRKGSIL